eukprot:3381152-Rhodomonas_salina.2
MLPSSSPCILAAAIVNQPLFFASPGVHGPTCAPTASYTSGLARIIKSRTALLYRTASGCCTLLLLPPKKSPAMWWMQSQKRNGVSSLLTPPPLTPSRYLDTRCRSCYWSRDTFFLSRDWSRDSCVLEGAGGAHDSDT